MKVKYLKLKRSFYLNLIGFISVFGFMAGCSSTKNTNSNANNNTSSSKDTVVIHKDSIIYNNENNMQMKYGVPANFYKKEENPPQK